MRLEQHLSNSTDKYNGKAKDWILKTVFEVSNSQRDAMKIERFIKKQKSRNLILLLCDSEFITPAGTGRDLSLRDFCLYDLLQ
jgi:putative endonuclease